MAQNIPDSDASLPYAQESANGSPSPFSIAASVSLQERRSRTLKHGDTFALFDGNGDALTDPGSPEGLYHRDTRYLSHLALSIFGARPMMLSSTLRDDNAMLTCDLTNPDLYDGDGHCHLEHDLIHIQRSRFLWKGACFERLTIRNFDNRPQRIRLSIAFGADFADLFEVRGETRERRGERHAPEIQTGRIKLSYTGLDKRLRTTSLRFEPIPNRLSGDRAGFDLNLDTGEVRLLFVEIRCDEAVPDPAPASRAFFVALRDARKALRASYSRMATISASNDIFNEAIRRSVSDLHMLITETPEGPYPYAGIPWFSTVFGRDALITALETLWIDPGLARGVLAHLAANQATAVDPAADAEPGKILHEVRHGEMAELGEVPFRRYYGSVDSTPLFVFLAGAYLQRTGDLDLLRKIWPNIEAALGWIETGGDRDGDGFVEYGRQAADGLVNQGWKDSKDSVFHEDGQLAQGPIALSEVQAYVYGAWMAAADIARKLQLPARAAELEIKAKKLREIFDSTFYDEALGTYVLALDRDKRPCRVRTSNAGHALFTGIAYPERAKSVAATLMNGASFSNWGVRTLAATEARYNPMSYHNGSIWPHDNALIAAGFARYGYRNEAARIFEGLFAASTYIDLRRLPELFCGFARQRGRGPTFYPVACSPQAWAAGASLSLIQSCLGLGIDAELRGITFDRPFLPSFLNEITLKGLSVNGASATVCVKRNGTEIGVDVLSRTGEIHVSSGPR